MVVTRTYLDISFTSSFFHLLMKQKPDVTVKIIPLAIFFFTGGYVRHFQHPTPH